MKDGSSVILNNSSDRNANIDFSINITCHAEGLLAYKTLRSMKQCANKLADNGVSYEINIVADNPDSKTREFLESGNDILRNVNIYYVEFGNVAESRNYIIEKSNGEYVSLIDGDDLVSENYLLECKKAIDKAVDTAIAHPAVQIQFDVDNANNYAYWEMNDAADSLDYKLMLVQYNQFPSPLVAKKKTLSRVKYTIPENGYGYEDFSYILDQISAGGKHIVAPGTAFFYRRRSGGMQNTHIGESALLRQAALFDFSKDNLAKYETSDSEVNIDLGDKMLSIAGNFYNSRIGLAARRCTPQKIKNAIKARRKRIVPDWVIREWKKINHIDNALWPDEHILNHIQVHPCTVMGCCQATMRVGLAFARLSQALPKKIDYAIFTYDPLGAGGTEKVMINYIKALQEKHPDWNFVVFRKLPDIFPFEVPDNVTFVDLDEYIGHLVGHEYDIVLDRLFVQTGIKRIHAFWNAWSVHNPIYKWIKNHRRYVQSNDVKIYVSWFMDEFVRHEGDIHRITTFADPGLTSVIDLVEKVMTDNQTIIDKAVEATGIPRDKFVAHYQPVNLLGNQLAPDRLGGGSFEVTRVLWASRLSHQKRPDIVKQIANRLKDRGLKNFHIDVYGRQQNYRGSYFKDLDNVTYRGEFNGVSSINTTNYDIFLYTSQVDGLPNILLEIGSLGLPIVASNDGGVCEVVQNGSTGWLIDIDDIDGYVNALVDAAAHPDKCRQYISVLQDMIGRRHTRDQFVRDVNDVIE